MIPNTQTWRIGDVLKVTQGGEIHYEKVIQLAPKVITEDMNPEEYGEISTQSLSDAKGIVYEIMPSWKIAALLENNIPRFVAFSIADKFYGSDYPLQQSTFDNAAKDWGY